MDVKKLIDRAKNICLNPRDEWNVIAAETTPINAILVNYVLPLAAVAAIAGFIGGSFVGLNAGMFGSYVVPVGTGFAVAVYKVVMAVVFVFVLGFIIDALATTFGGQRNFNQAAKLAAYSYTPAWIAGIVTILPILGILVLIGSLYGLYILYLGLPRLMKNPEQKSLGYTVVTVICAIVLSVVITVLGALLGGGMGAPAG